MQQEILIHSAHHETRVVVMEHGAVQELHIERHSQRGVVGNVYLGKVIRVLPGMQSAFVDIGLDKAAFLHVADLWQHKRHDADMSANKLTPIERLVFPGQTLMVQVLKDPLGTKGARLTTQISLAGRYLVLLPQDSHIGLSQKISDEARRRELRERLGNALPVNFEFGLIARTQAEDASVKQLSGDVAYLNHVWLDVERAAKTQPAPALLHGDANLSQRALRDLCTDNTRAIRVDGAACYDELRVFAEQYMQAVTDKLSLHTGEHGLFDLAQVDAEVNAALQRRVNLKSGAYLVIDQTESMCTIDVNTGSYVGAKNFSDTVLRTNLEAAHAIARQLRLRNLGGIILIDFIDMASNDQREKVRAELARQLVRDPVRSYIHGFTSLGLMELTRKRVRESLAHVMMQACECCAQTGLVKTAQTVGFEILREIAVQAKQFNCNRFQVKISAQVFDWFKLEPNRLIQSLESRLNVSVQLLCQDGIPSHLFDVLID
jgi:ribonuclease G